MIDALGFLGVLRSELISTRRLIRTKVLIIVNALLIVPVFVLITMTQGAESAYLPSTGILSPQYSILFFGAWALLISFIGTIFLSFDVLHRDRRSRIEEVIHSKHLNNVSLVLGRAVASTIVMWVPLLVIFGICAVIGFILELNQRVMYGTFEPLSFVGWLFITAPVALFTWSTVLALVASVCRIRILIFVVSLLVLFVEFLIGAFTPLTFSSFLTFGINAAYFPSTITPSLMSSEELLHRISLLLIAGGAVLIAGILHPRRDHLNKLAVAALAFLLIALGVGNSSLLIQDAIGNQAQIRHWAQIHGETQSSDEIDIDHIEGRVSIFPGERMDLLIDIHVRTTDSYSGGELFFNFNPGLNIQKLTLVEDPNATYRFEDGLVSVQPSVELSIGKTFVLTLNATGVPNPSFSYLDSSRDVGKAVGMDGSLATFGIHSSLFQEEYVALMSDVRWLPQVGPYRSSRAEPGGRIDFFTLDLEVELPENWLVAGPGKRKPLTMQGGREVFEFSPRVRVPQVTLLAAEFKRYSLQKRGIEFELLIDDYHTPSLEYFEESMNDIHDEIDRILDVASASGITYPFSSLSFAEIPISLRTIGGGWRMDTVQAQPGIVMLREHTFLKANFRYVDRYQEILTQVGFESYETRDNDIPHKVRQIREYFNNDLTGGNALDGIARNLFLLRTNPTGVAAPALAQLNHALVSKILFDEVGYFSPFALSYARDYDFLLFPPILTRTNEEFSSSTSSLFVRSARIRPKLDRADTHASTLTKMSELSMKDLPYDSDEETTFEFIDRKAYSAAASLLDGTKPESIGLYFGILLDTYDGRNFQLKNVEELIDETEIGFEFDFREWITATALPGFLVSTPALVRIKDSELGLPRYQTSFHVRNDEPSSGSFSIHLVTAVRADVAIAGHRLSGNESVKFNLLTEEPTRSVFLRPYLALNHQPIRLDIGNTNLEHINDLDPSPMIEQSAWKPKTSRYIIVDDLDEGFSVVNPQRPDGNMLSWLRERNSPKLQLDHGLPEHTLSLRVFAPELNQWIRDSDMVSWGKYRKTTAIYLHDEPDLRARFEVTLPEIGKWHLDYHVAQRYRARYDARLNKYPLAIISGSSRFDVELPIETSSNTWLSVGSFDLPSYDVTVEVTSLNNANGMFYYTVADAIRWSKVLDDAP